MASKYETVMTTSGDLVKIEASLTRGFFEATIKHEVKTHLNGEPLPFAELQAAALKAVIHLAKEQLQILQPEKPAS